MEELFQEELLENEKILWSGQPNPRIIFTVFDVFLIPFSLLWGGFAIFWEAMAVSTGVSFFSLFGIPFVLAGLYFIFGRFIYKVWKKKHTYYAVTNKRALVLTNVFGRSLKAVFLDSLPTMNKSISSKGYGTIKFGNSPFMNSAYENTGMDFFNIHSGQGIPAFFDISEAMEVYNLINKIRNQSQKQ